MAHGTIRAATLPIIINLITESYGINDNEALKMFYESHIGLCYADDDSGLYGQSALYVFSLFQEEQHINSGGSPF
ncbi:MAG: hypothetical protein FWG91_03115 [Lachnospiraceae bacterium]|nr:hypothetical protein [Lachnospiraceae bacterium]